MLAHQTPKLSPQPHRRLTLGLSYWKPSLRPSRAKSIRVPSSNGKLLGSTMTFTP